MQALILSSRLVPLSSSSSSPLHLPSPQAEQQKKRARASPGTPFLPPVFVLPPCLAPTPWSTIHIPSLPSLNLSHHHLECAHLTSDRNIFTPVRPPPRAPVLFERRGTFFPLGELVDLPSCYFGIAVPAPGFLAPNTRAVTEELIWSCS
ncbi:hypothetical protein AWENTII_012882 [Aspergillus wentii]